MRKSTKDTLRLLAGLMIALAIVELYEGKGLFGFCLIIVAVIFEVVATRKAVKNGKEKENTSGQTTRVLEDA